MTKQKKHLPHILILTIFCTIMLYSSNAYANVVVASSGFKNMLALSISLPIFAAICAYLFTLRAKKPSLRAQRFLFLFFALVPALFFYAAAIPAEFQRNNLSIRMIENTFIPLGFLSLIWFGLNYIVYGIYSHIMDMPRPFLFRWVTRKRLLVIFTSGFILTAGYIYYPKAYFYYHITKGNAGNVESQLWLGKAHEALWTKRLLGDRARYTERNYFKARDWYEKAAAQGDTEAYVELARLYGGMKGGFMSHDVARAEWQREVNLETAKYWAQKAADAGKNSDLLIRIEKMTSESRQIYTQKKLSGNVILSRYGLSLVS